MNRYTILVGTMTGTAELVAEALAQALESTGARVDTLRMDAVGLEVFERPGRVVICCSTFGAGDVPDNAFPLLDALEQVRPDLSSVSYSVFALGDRIYRETFCGGGRTFDALIAALGARRFADSFFHDASDGSRAEAACVSWAATFDLPVREVAASDRARLDCTGALR